MNALHQNTKRRLQKIPQISHVWEGDRRPLSGLESYPESGEAENGDCIIWVDGSEGMVRAMDMVPAEMGPEAIVRTLLRAIENPQNPAQPARPQKIIVRDREIQFFLRGALQNLDIAIEYVPELPLIDELFRGLETISSRQPPSLPPQYEKLLLDVAYCLWNQAPWDVLADSDILAIDLNYSDITTVYACVMGMLGKEYGVILYRSLDSLKRFRAAVLAEKSLDLLEQEFLAQDCWFLNFEPDEDLELDEEDETIDLETLLPGEIQPVFGSLHPLEGIRPFLDEEEAQVIYLALEALVRFYEELQLQLAQETVPQIRKTYSLSLPLAEGLTQTLPVTVATMPELSSELAQMLEEAEGLDEDSQQTVTVPIQDDLVPENSLIKLDIFTEELVAILEQAGKIYPPSLKISPIKAGMPVILIQTSRPKAKITIEQLQTRGGVQGLCFNPGEDTFSHTEYDLGILQTGDGSLSIFAEFVSDEPSHAKAMDKWQQVCQQNDGYCGLVIAMGVTGAYRGQPKIRDLMALFPTKLISSQALGLGILQLMPEWDFEEWDDDR